MKQSAVKTLGAAALGAAFAAVGAGAADAAPAVPDTSQTLGTVTRALPGAGHTLAQGQSTVGAGMAAARPAVANPAGQPGAPVGGLLGGLPLQDLPGHAAPVKGIALS